MDAKKEWNTHFEAYIRELDAKKPVIWTGDLNVAPTALGRFPLRSTQGCVAVRRVSAAHHPRFRVYQLNAQSNALLCGVLTYRAFGQI